MKEKDKYSSFNCPCCGREFFKLDDINLSKDFVEGIYFTLKDKFAFNDLRELTEALGGTIELKDFRRSSDCFCLIILGEKDFRIFIDQNSYHTIQNFEIAMGLSYYIFYNILKTKEKGIKLPIAVSRYEKGSIVRKASLLSINLLLPKNHFKQKYIEFDKSVLKLSDYFEVSIDLIKTRERQLYEC